MQEENPREALYKFIKIVDKAIMMERNARIFYSKAAHEVESAEGKKMLNWLANFEAGHEARLIEKRKELFDHPAMEGVTPFPIEDNQILTEAKPIELPKEPSDTDILVVAIENEVAAQAYYQLKGSHAPDDDTRTMYEHFAHDEGRHVKILSEQLKHIKVERFWMDLAAFDDAGQHPGG